MTWVSANCCFFLAFLNAAGCVTWVQMSSSRDKHAFSVTSQCCSFHSGMEGGRDGIGIWLQCVSPDDDSRLEIREENAVLNSASNKTELDSCCLVSKLQVYASVISYQRLWSEYANSRVHWSQGIEKVRESASSSNMQIGCNSASNT